MRLLRRALGGVLLLLTLVPVYRLLDPSQVGPFNADLLEAAEANLSWGWLGLVSVGLAAVALGILVRPDPLRKGLAAVADALIRPRLSLWAPVMALTAGGLAVAASLLLFRGLPTGVDEIASLVQARYLAAGQLAGPQPEPSAAFLILNTVVAPGGWVSLYAPFHLLLLAGGLIAGAPWLVGPALLAVAVGAGTVATHLLLGPERLLEARVGSALMAVSPFLVFLGGTYLSHTSAAAALALVVWMAVLARDGAWGWSIAAGAAVGAAVTSRPWTGLVLGAGLTGGLWLVEWCRRGERLRWLATRAGGTTLGGLPFAVGLFLYDRTIFGRALRLGYTWAYGPAHGLGFHRDPWGNVYGPLEALGYTSANLLALGINLFETPFPIVVLVGAWLLRKKPLPRGSGPLLAWAALPMAANFFYWHHGFHMGPRMLYEGAPAWAALTGIGAVSLARKGSRLRDGVLWALILAVLPAPFLAVQRGRVYRHTDEQVARFRAPQPSGPKPEVVFVHGSWAERLSARLQGDGMRMDTLETVLRRNGICRVQEYVTARVEEGRPTGRRPRLDLVPEPGHPPDLRPVLLSPGNRVMVDPSAPFTPRCRREALADRNGVVSLAPLLWQGDLPGLERGDPLFVRDLGPEANRAVLDRYPERRPLVFFTPDTAAAPRLQEYAEGMARIWGVEILSDPPGP